MDRRAASLVLLLLFVACTGVVIAVATARLAVGTSTARRAR